MPRYIIKQTAAPLRGSWWEAQPQALPYPQVAASDPVDTRLLDKYGNKIVRVPDQVGFVRFKD